MSNEWVLIVDGGIGQNRAAVAAVRALHRGGYRVAVTAANGRSLAAASRFCDRVIPTLLPDHDEFAPTVRDEFENGNYLAMLPATDAAVTSLGAPGSDLVDKAILEHQAQLAGLPIPVSHAFQTASELLSGADSFAYPIVVKPRLKFSRRQIPAQRIDSPSQLRAATLGSGPFMVQRYVEDEIHSVNGVMWRGELVASVHQRHDRLWPPICGDACAATTTEPDVEREKQLIQLLSDYEGMFQAEFAGPYLLDINPRVYGSLPLAVSAGANLPVIFCGLLKGQVSERETRAQPGIGYRWWEGEVRHLLSHLREGHSATRTTPERLSLRRTQNRFAQLDPGPAFARLKFAWQHRAGGQSRE